MATIPERLPSLLSERSASTASQLINRGGQEIDIAVGGLPFRLATSQDLPSSVETIPVRKEQFDAESDPGEQSLSGWWRRSQDSFHEGAGSLYAESRLASTPGYSYYDSMGVEVFDRNRMTLIREMQLMDGSQAFGRLGACLVSGTRANLCTNPNFETSTAGCSVGGDGETPPTLSVSTAQFHQGTQSLKATYNGDNGVGFPPSVIMASAPLVVGHTYTASLWVYVPTGCNAVQVIFGDFGTASTTHDQWERLSCTHTAGSTADGVSLWPSTPAVAGTFFYVDEVLIEEATSVRPYFDGASPNSAWSGTANLSTSTETVTSTTAQIKAIGAGQLWTSPDTATAFTALHSPASPVVDGFLSGLSFYDITSGGTLYEGLVAAPGSASNWTLGSTPSRLAFGKARLWIVGGRSIWQPNLTLASGSAQTAVFVHPSQGWNYTCIAEGPSAMYFGGHDGNSSSIQAIGLADDGSLPALSGAKVTAVLPDGELVQELAILAGQFIGIGTNKGFRVGVFNGQDFTYGPLLFAPSGVTACTGITTQDRFFLVSFRTTDEPAVIYKIDTGTQLADGVFPYAKNVYIGDPGSTGVITSLAVVNGDVLAANTSGAVYAQGVNKVASGWLQTGRIRFRTNEHKVFKYLDIETKPLFGAIQLSGFQESGTQFDIATFNEEGSVASGSYAISSDLGPQRQISVKLALFRDTVDPTLGPEINSFLVRALPAAKPQRMITLPLLCFDFEQARSGQRYGNEGFANDRLSALQALEDSSDVLIFQDYRYKQVTGLPVVIESLRFVQTASGQQYDRTSGTGGIAILQLRTVSA